MLLGIKKAQMRALDAVVGGFSTKIHAMTDALGNPVKFVISPGNEHYINHAEKLVNDLRNTQVLADKGYDSKNFIAFLTERNCEALIPSRSKDFDRYNRDSNATSLRLE